MFSSKISTGGADFRGKNYYRHNRRLVTKYHINKHVHYPHENKFLTHFQAIMLTFACNPTHKFAPLLLCTADFIEKY